MKIKKIELENFMLFDSLKINFSPNINVISGENSTGKTAILKILYTTLKAVNETRISKGDFTKEKLEITLVKKMQGIFRPNDDVIGRMVNRIQGSNRSEIAVFLNSSFNINFGFGNRQQNHLDLDFEPTTVIDDCVPVFIPPKEIISSTSNFASLYDDYHIDFEETYYDLARLLARPLKKGPNTKEQIKVMKDIENILNGNITQEENKFYLKVRGSGKFEMGLVSEGYRKLSTIMYLILSGSLNKNTILFWDEPEVNMNPKMIRHISDVLITLASMGVQIFVATHDYFVMQCLNLHSSYDKLNKSKLNIKFISLYKEQDENNRFTIKHESEKTLSELSHNSIMEEFDALYDREQEMMK